MVRTSERSQQLCDCGCGSTLSTYAVENNHRYIKGHKPKGALITTKKVFHTLPPGPVKSVNSHLMVEFARGQKELTAEQLKQATSDLNNAQDRVHLLTKQERHWEAILTNLEILIPGGPSDNSGS